MFRLKHNKDSKLPAVRFYGFCVAELYNAVRLHSAIGYIAPQAKLEGREEQIQQQRQHRLAQARQARREAYPAMAA